MGVAKFFLAVGIAVILAAFVGYGLYAIYPPEYGSSSGISECTQKYNCQKQISECRVKYNNNHSEPGYAECNQIVNSEEYKNCQENYKKCTEEAEKNSQKYKYFRNCFYILLLVGIISIVAGILMIKLEGIGSGLIGGGVLIILWSLAYTSQYWLTFAKWVKLIALGVVLVILLGLGYWFIDRKRKEEKNDN